MSGKMSVGIAAIALLIPASIQAQNRVVMVEQDKIESTQAGGARTRIMAVAEAKITPGRPYSAEAVTESSQVLADGNRISRRSVVRVYRDTDGRTRREVVAEDGSLRTITIADPIAKTNYTLDPVTKVAYAAGGGLVAPMRTPEGGTYTFGGGARGGGGAVAAPSRQPAATATISGGGRGGSVAALRERSDESNPNVKKEDLGSQNVEGVMATGTRTTTLIPAGQIGNVQEIRIVSEQWFSDELQLLVMTRHSDPRSGETVYRLRNILRAEPDPALFSVPPDYTIQQRAIRRPQ